jgi:hypothetical protein
MTARYPSGRPHTDLAGIDLSPLLAGNAPLARPRATRLWLDLKARQRLEDDTSARVCWARQAALRDMPHRWPEPTLADCVRSALPAIRAATGRHREGAS